MMIAHVSQPGSVHFRWTRCRTRKEGVQWIDRNLDELRERNPVVGRFGYGILSDREAAKVRYRDGRRVYDEQIEDATN